MNDALDNFFKELAEAYAGEFATCSECAKDYKHSDVNSDIAVKNGASLCDTCFMEIEEQSKRDARCAICQESFAASQMLRYSDVKGGLLVCLQCFLAEKS